MTRPDIDHLDDEVIRQKLSYRLQRVSQLLEALPAAHHDERPDICIVESYSQKQLEMAAEQVLSGFPLTSDSECSECGQRLRVYRDVTIRARRPLGIMSWYIDACVCGDCEIELAPQADSLDVLASAWIAKWEDPEKRRPLMLTGVEIDTSSGSNSDDRTLHGGEE